MFAMFHLGRPDIFPLGDLAVRKGLIHLYTLKVGSCVDSGGKGCKAGSASLVVAKGRMRFAVIERNAYLHK